jgi:hypothetical protein
MKWCVLYLASPKDTVLSDINEPRFNVLLASIKITRRCFPNVDIYVFHEDFTQTEFDACPEVTKFIQVDFETGSEYYVKGPCRKGYMMMCRFFSGIVQKHPVFEQYTHYMRLDDDSYFMDPAPTETQIDNLLSNDYVFRSLFNDLKNHQSLYDYTIDYIRSIGHAKYIPQIEAYLRSLQFLDSKNKYTGFAPYNNFHLSSFRLWKAPMISDFIDRLERDHLILKNGWLDANIHAMIMCVLAPLIGMNVRMYGEFGYRHNKHVSILNSSNIRWDNSLPFYPI